MPTSVVKAKCAPYLQRGQPARRTQIINRDDYNIVATYGPEYRGLVQYYLLAVNIRVLHRLHWVMLTSMLKTLASKHRSTVTRMAAKHKAITITPSGPRTCLEAVVERAGKQPLVARFGGMPLKRQKNAFIDERIYGRGTYPRKELVTRLLKGQCELCEHTGQVQVHQVRKLAELDPTGPLRPPWVQVMARRRRKTLVVCAACHDHIHAGPLTANLTA